MPPMPLADLVDIVLGAGTFELEGTTCEELKNDISELIVLRKADRFQQYKIKPSLELLVEHVLDKKLASKISKKEAQTMRDAIK